MEIFLNRDKDRVEVDRERDRDRDTKNNGTLILYSKLVIVRFKEITLHKKE